MKWRCLLLAPVLVGCASLPRPRIMSDVDAASASAQARESKELAPQAHAAAEALRTRAEKAHAEGDNALAQVSSERALAAYSHAFVLARLARAERDLENVTRELGRAKTDLADVDEKHKRVGAEASDLELRIRVAEDAVPLAPNAPAGPEREKARLEAARALASQARLLCVAARLVDPKKEGVAGELERLVELEKTLAGTPKATPIDAAISARSACLEHLTKARRAVTREAPAAGLADTLLAELGRAGSYHPFRDDRGVVVTLRGLFDAKGALTAEGRSVLDALAKVAKAHPSFPVLVVLHGKAGTEDMRKKSVTDALTAAGVARLEAVSAGTTQPVVDPARAGSAARNDRIELVFVAPAH